MIKVNIEEALKKLEESRKVLENKMKNMVAGFAYTVTNIASNNTPLGDPEKFFGLYELREQTYGIDIKEGFHKGAWQYSETKGITFDPTVYGLGSARERAYADARMQYKLGDNFYIGASGPAYGALEAAVRGQGGSMQAPQGIMQPSTEEIMQIAGINLKKYFEEG